MPGTQANPYIKNFSYSQEQDLMEDLIIEAIQFYGQDMKWIPRISVNEDQIYGEDPLSKFTDTYDIELYIKNVEVQRAEVWDPFKGIIPGIAEVEIVYNTTYDVALYSNTTEETKTTITERYWSKEKRWWV